MGSINPPRQKAADAHGAQPGNRRCPICSAPAEQQFRPFCSRRCADVDLSRWMRGAYVIPGRVEADEDGDDTAAAAGSVRGEQASEED